MEILTKYLPRAAALIVLLTTLAGCIGSPLPPGSVAALYRWDDRQTAIATRVGLSIDGYNNGDFSFADVFINYPLLADIPDAPLLLEACDEDVCYSMVVFGQMFTLDANGVLNGYASMTALSTAMANQVMSLEASEVRTALDALSGRLRANGLADYNQFIVLDPERIPEQRSELINERLYDTANSLAVSAPGFTVDELLGEAGTTTEDLVVPDGFLFDSSWALTVDVDVSSTLAEAAYLLVCSEFGETPDGYEVDYGSCQLSTALTQGVYQGELIMTGGVTELLAVVLPLQRPEEALHVLYQRQEDGELFRVR